MVDDVTLGELARRLESLRLDAAGQFDAINRRLDSLTFVPRDVHEVQLQSLTERVKRVEEASAYRYRFMSGGLISLTVALIVVIVGLIAK